MAYLKSVGVRVTETDLTPIVQATSASIGAYVGHFNWGPCDIPTNVNSESTLGQIFGFPQKANDENAASFLTAGSFLKYGDNLKVIRCVSPSAKNAKGVAPEVSGSTGPITSTALFKNENLFNDLDRGDDIDGVFYARFAGTKGNSLGVKIYHIDNTDKLVSANSENVTECKSFFTYLPETTDWGTQNSYANDEVHVMIVDIDGEITGTKDSVLERWEGLSLNPEAKLVNGAANYFADVLNRGSSYIYVTNPQDLYTTEVESGETVYSVGTPSSIPQYTFGGGLDGERTINNVVTALDIFDDVENIDISLLFAEAFMTDTNREVNDKIGEVATNRGDCIGFLSAPLDLYTEGSDADKLQYLLTSKDNTGTLSSYVVFDSTPVYVYNRYSDKYDWIPACGHMAGLCAYTDEIADAWFSPAGLNRGQLRGITKLAYNPKQADRDELYSTNINSIMTFPGQGTVLWGDKTGQPRATAFDRINVRRLFNVIQKEIKKAARYSLFELNDPFTRAAFKNSIEPFLRDIQGRRGITEFKVVCDETNNTPDIVDSNQFVASIYIKPARSINFISLNFVATRTGLSFTEV
jgi:hypothetical protein